MNAWGTFVAEFDPKDQPIVAALVPRLQAMGLAQVQDLARLSVPDLAKIISAAAASLPPGAWSDSQSQRLATLIVQKAQQAAGGPTQPGGGGPGSLPTLKVEEVIKVLGLAPPGELLDYLHQRKIETVTDLARAGGLAHRKELPVKPGDLAVAALDAAARLAAAGAPVANIVGLLDNKITGALDLASLSRDQAAQLSATLKLSDSEMSDLLGNARATVRRTVQWLFNTLVYHSGPLPDWLAAEGAGSCSCCAHERSVISRFAYLLYLMIQPIPRKFDEIVAFWDNTLKQNLAALTPVAGMEPAPQIVICNEVLARAYPMPLTPDEELLYRRYIVAALLGMTPLTIAGVVNEAMALLALPVVDRQHDQARRADLARRLQETLDAEILAPSPSFGPAEVQALETVLRKAALDRLTAEVRADADFAGSTPAELQTEAERKLEEQLAATYQQAQVARREAYKRRARAAGDAQNDAELAARYCIEVSLDACQTTTRLDQAIRSVQRYMDQQYASATDEQTRALNSYQSYDVWRAEKIGSLFPDLGVVLRDDIFVGEEEALPGLWNRGSIIANRQGARAELDRQLSMARAAVSDTANACLPSGAFADTSYIAYFKKGMDVIDRVLCADDRVQDALHALDSDEPGVALSRLHDALGELDAMGEKAFRDGSPWRNPAHIAYSTLLDLSAPERRQRLSDLAEELLHRGKAIFDLDDESFAVAAFDPGTHMFANADRWKLEEGFRLANADDGPGEFAAGALFKGRSNGPVTDVFGAYYLAGDNWSNYELAAEVMLLDGDSAHGERAGEQFGVVGHSRLTPPGTGQASCYRLVIVSDRVTDDSWAPNGSDFGGLTSGPGGPVSATYSNYHLALQRSTVNASGAVEVTEIARDTRNIILDLNQIFAFRMSFDGNRIIGSLTLPDGSQRSIECQDDHPLPAFAGGFGFHASRTVSALFRLCQVTSGSLSGGGTAPFFAPRRQERGRSSAFGSHALYTAGMYANHQLFRAGLARDMLAEPLAFLCEREFEQDMVVDVDPTRDPVVLKLKFPPGHAGVSLDALDTLLDELLALSFHLRFVVVPLRMAQAHLRSGDYARAAGLLRLIYDDGPATAADREVCLYLTRPLPGFTTILGDDARVMRLRLAEVYLPWADWLFRQNSDETRYQARLLCERVLALHEDPGFCSCGQPLQQLRAWIEAEQAQARAQQQNQGRVSTTFATALDEQLKSVINQAGKILQELSELSSLCVDTNRLRAIVQDLPMELPPAAQAVDLLGKVQAQLDDLRTAARQQAGLVDLRTVAAPRVQSAFAVAELALSSRTLGLAGQGSADNYVDASVLASYMRGLCMPDHPLARQQKEQACLLLYNLEHCYNVLGYDDRAIPPLRFDALLHSARSFADLALVAEKDLLNFRQSFESETFSLLSAQGVLAASGASLNLESMRVEQARQDAILAGLQLGQARSSQNHWEALVAAGPSDMERLALMSAFASAALAADAALVAPFSIGSSGVSISPGAWPSSAGGAAGSLSGFAALAASYERQAEERDYQMRLSRWGVAIAEQNVREAQARRDLAAQQQLIAELNNRFAYDAVQFLSNKFLNAALWLWMERSMRAEYRKRLNYAISAAYMAERALAFELQTPLQVIRFDYFDPSHDGMLGAARLQTDLATLEGARLGAARRRLQLSKTLSLAGLMPVDFQQFLRDGTGQLPFRTLLKWFDEDFPGHYLRLIKSVKVTVIALTPPVQGIRATLSNNGISRVVTAPAFREETIRRDPESIALSAPYQSSGVFVLDYRDELLLPFEGGGVEADWVFELPKAANQFDYGTLADVLITIEYTALVSEAYRRQVIRRLDRRVTGARAFSFRHEFADQWWELHNPDRVDTPMTVKFKTGADDFPPNLGALQIEQVALYLAPDGVDSVDVSDLALQFAALDAAGHPAPIGGSATTRQGTISTRRDSAGAWAGGDATNWLAMLGKPVSQDWTLAFPDSLTDPGAPRNLFKNEQIQDILLVITYAGQSAEWPA